MKPTDPISQAVFAAIESATGLTAGDIAGRSRRLEVVFGRFIFARHMYTYGATLSQIARLTGHNHATIRYHLTHYDDEYATNPHFRNMADRVAKLMDGLVKKSTKPQEKTQQNSL